MPNRSRPAAVLLVLAFLAPSLLAPPASAASTPGGWVANDPIPYDPFSLVSWTALFENHSGGALVLGWEFFNYSARLVASTYSLRTGWTPRALIVDTGVNSATAPVGALGQDGTAVAAWTVFAGEDGENSTVGASVYTPGTGWSAGRTMSSTLGASVSDAAVLTDGRTMVTWHENLSGTWRARFALYAPGSGWSAAATIDATAEGFNPMVAPGPNGTCAAIWLSTFGNTTYYVRYSRFTPGSGWSAAVNLSALPSGDIAYALRIRSAPDGTTFVTWVEGDGYFYNASVRRQDAGGTWDPTVPLTTSGFVASPATLVVDADGAATVGWIDADVDGGVVIARYKPGSGWQARTTIGASDPYGVAPMLAVSEDGTVMAVWSHADTHGNAASYARYLPGSGWTAVGSVDGSGAYADGSAVSLGGTTFLYAPSSHEGWNGLFDITALDLSVQSPSGGAVFGYPVIDVTGTAEPRSTVTVNGVIATLDGGGAWMARVALGRGSNDLRTVARDLAGNTAYDNRTVTFDDPVPALEAALAEAQANASAAQAAAAAAQANVTATNAQVTALQNAMAASSAEQVRLQAEINALNQSVANAHPSAPAASDGLALMIAVVGVALGAGGLAVGMMAQRRGRVPQSEAPPKP